jgi:hypothetical protein
MAKYGSYEGCAICRMRDEKWRWRKHGETSFGEKRFHFGFSRQEKRSKII